MLPQNNRLRTKRDIARVYHRGISVSFARAPLKLRVRRTPLSFSRFAFIVSNKVAKRAVARNLLKRRLRAITRALLPEISKGFDVLVTALPQSTAVAHRDIEEIYKKLLNKAKILFSTEKNL